MNFQIDPSSEVLRVMMINPLAEASQLLAAKIMSGVVFGERQLIDMTLLIFNTELDAAQGVKNEIMSCAFPCYNSIKITNELPTIADADVFCFITRLENPNRLNYNGDSRDQFNSIYRILKVAKNLRNPNKDSTKGVNKPIIIGDGLIVIDILNHFGNILDSDILFYCTTLTTIVKAVISDHLKVHRTEVNEPLAWSVDEETFYVQFEDSQNLTKSDPTKTKKCWDSVAVANKYDLEYSQINPGWLRKELLEKVQEAAMKNPHGCIMKAATIADTLREIWIARMDEPGTNLRMNVGVISNGSLDTVKGLPYVLPLIFSGESWAVNKSFEEESHLRSEIKRMNKIIKKQHDMLVEYCEEFLAKHFEPPTPTDDRSESSYMHSTRTKSTGTTKSSRKRHTKFKS